MADPGVEDLPGEAVRLLQDRAAVAGVGVVAEIRAFVDEAPPGGVDHDAPRVAVLLEAVADREVAELRRIVIPGDGMAARPVAIGRRADLQRHADAVAGVEAAAAHFRQLPAGAEIAGAPFRIGLEAAGGEHHRLRRNRLDPAILLEADAAHRVAVVDQVQHPRAVADADPRRPGNPGVAVDEAGPAAPGLQRQPAPEAEAAVDPERLPAVDRHEADALAAQPLHRFGGFRDQPLA